MGEVVPPSGYRRFRRALTVAIGRMQQAAGPRGEMPTYENAAAALRDAWVAEGPVGHTLEAVYRETGERVVARMAEVIASEGGATYHSGTWIVDVGTTQISLRPDRVIEQPWGTVVAQVFHIGLREHDRLQGIHALLLIGTRARFPDHSLTVETIDPETGDTAPCNVIDEEGALAPYRKAIKAIERGAFPAAPGIKQCPSCPWYLVCGA